MFSYINCSYIVFVRSFFLDKTYFYKSDRFWRYNETIKMMDPGYPRHIERWRGVPENIDAATTWKDGILSILIRHVVDEIKF